MDFKDKFAQVFCNLIPLLQVASTHLSELMSEDLKMPKAVRNGELNPVIKFELGPFENVDDRFYVSNPYVKSVKFNDERTQETITKFKNRKRSERRRTGNRENSNWKTRKEYVGFEKQKVQPNWVPVTVAYGAPSEVLTFGEQMSNINNEIKKVKLLSVFLTSLKSELHEIEKSLVVEPFEKLIKHLEKNLPGGENENENEVKMADKNSFKGGNNVTFHNQYQIESIFIINRLSEENNSKLKETEVEVFNELTARKMKELLEKAVNSLSRGGIPQSETPALTQPPLQENEMLNQLQRNFSRMFHHQNVTLKQINQMSKIIDFVERYHGTVSDLKTSPVSQVVDDRKSRNVRTKNKKPTVLHELSRKPKTGGKYWCDDGFDVFADKSEDVNEKAAARRKGRID